MLEQGGRANFGDGLLINSLMNRFVEFGNFPPFFGTGFKIGVKTHIPQQVIYAGWTDTDATPVYPGRDQEFVHRNTRFTLEPLHLPQGTVPMTYPGKGVGITAGIEHDQGHGHFIEMELVNETVARLTGQIPKQGFPCFLLAIG